MLIINKITSGLENITGLELAFLNIDDGLHLVKNKGRPAKLENIDTDFADEVLYIQSDAKGERLEDLPTT